ncbi:MAG: hypothetical protein AAFQ15_02345 [Pseudomonadota bacterium]
MAKWISGRDALALLDRRLNRLRTRLNDAIQTADSIDGRLAEIQSHRVGAMQRLADMRLDIIQQADFEDLDRLHQQALELLQSHSAYIEEERETIEAASGKITDLETRRTDLAQSRETLEAELDAKLAGIEARLNEDKAYRGLVEMFEDTEAIADRADQKLAIAIDEREEKSAAYLGDPLFSYLWERGFGTTQYKGGGLFKMLDGWVAKLCKYEGARQNFARLNDITDWLGDHAQDTLAAAELAKTNLEAAERQAIEDAGIPADEAKTEALRADIAAVDADIVSAETRHTALTEQHAKTLIGEEGPAKQARKLLERGLQNMSIPDLRQLAAETVTLDDDEIVDDLVELRTEEMSLELETDRVSDTPTRLGEELGAFEALRRRFKEARFDSDVALIKIALFDDALENLGSGRLSVSKALKQIHQSVRRKESRTRNGFGGRRPRHEFEAYDIINDVADLALKHGWKGGRRGRDIGFPSPTRRRKRFRSGYKKGGGFKTGGGF